MDEFIIREYRAGDEVEINQRFNEIFAASRSLEEWHWKFMGSPTHAFSPAELRIVRQQPFSMAPALAPLMDTTGRPYVVGEFIEATEFPYGADH